MSKKINLSLLLILLGSMGCTSFRTTVLSRFENDSVAPQQTNRKLKGLPVKLKVPSHVLVTISEQQILLANSQKGVEKIRTDAQSMVDGLLSQISELTNTKVATDRNYAVAKELQEKAQQAYNSDRTNPAIVQQYKDANKALASATIERDKADIAIKRLPELNTKLVVANANLVDVSSTAALGYVLVSFDPAQYIVHTELQYTDKIFLVDFKRPAGGILDLKEATMDDEQYFSKVKAEVTERTMADISTALNTLSGPLGKLKPGKDEKNLAIPTSSDTPKDEANKHTNFQESVVAMQRFDISEANWEVRMAEFVNAKLSQLNPQNAQLTPEYITGDAPNYAN